MEPSQVHLAYTDGLDMMSVSWTTAHNNTCLAPFVTYGVGYEQLNNKVQGDSIVRQTYATTNDTICE
jgi:hypothetical protein